MYQTRHKREGLKPFPTFYILMAQQPTQPRQVPRSRHYGIILATVSTVLPYVQDAINSNVDIHNVNWAGFAAGLIIFACDWFKNGGKN